MARGKIPILCIIPLAYRQPGFLIFSSVLFSTSKVYLGGMGVLARAVRFSVEKRGAKYHRERLGEALREEIETIVEGELGDPRIGLASVTAVELAEDSRSARVLVSVEGDDEEAQRSIEGLSAAVGFIRHEIADRLHLRRAPELVFQLDRSMRLQARVDELLKRTKGRTVKKR
jgi:ribosome-binding factor A